MPARVLLPSDAGWGSNALLETSLLQHKAPVCSAKSNLQLVNSRYFDYRPQLHCRTWKFRSNDAHTVVSLHGPNQYFSVSREMGQHDTFWLYYRGENNATQYYSYPSEGRRPDVFDPPRDGPPSRMDWIRFMGLYGETPGRPTSFMDLTRAYGLIYSVSVSVQTGVHLAAASLALILLTYQCALQKRHCLSWVGISILAVLFSQTSIIMFYVAIPIWDHHTGHGISPDDLSLLFLCMAITTAILVTVVVAILTRIPLASATLI